MKVEDCTMCKEMNIITDANFKIQMLPYFTYSAAIRQNTAVIVDVLLYTIRKNVLK